MNDDRKPFWSKCGKCGHIWTAAYCGMELTRFAAVLRSLHCPSCGETSNNIHPAKQEDGVLKEPA